MYQKFPECTKNAYNLPRFSGMCQWFLKCTENHWNRLRISEMHRGFPESAK